jgi:phosphatidylglycerol:prolipoprotein diacylglycerol transferase
VTVPTFGVLLALAYATAFWWLVRGARRTRLNVEQVMDLGMWSIIGALIGAKVLLAVRSVGDFAVNPGELWSLLTSAGDFYGGFVGGVLAAALFLYKHPALSFWRVADVAAPAIALGQAIGRIGCFMAGDDYGRATTFPWAVVFTDPDAARIGGAPLGIPLHPVQLYESAFCLLLFIALVWMTRRVRRQGTIILTYTIVYAVGRFVLEFFRGDSDRGFVGPLSTSQFIAVALLLICTVTILNRRGPYRSHAGS